MGILETLAVGAAGGAAVKGVDYLASRLTRRDIRKEERHAEIKRMVERLMRDTRNAADACGSLDFLLEVSPKDVPKSRDDYIDKRPPSDEDIWPHRVGDPALRKVVDELNAVRSQLLHLIILSAYKDRAEWRNEYNESIAKAAPLYEAADKRMDALGY